VLAAHGALSWAEVVHGAGGEVLAGHLLAMAGARGLTLAVAEADTGGLVQAWLTAWPGSSRVVRGGVVPYADDLKRDLLGVDPTLIAAHGAVSQAVVEALAEGVRTATGADLGLATTGIAGPSGARPEKPVGLAWVAVAAPARPAVAPYHLLHNEHQKQLSAADLWPFNDQRTALAKLGIGFEQQFFLLVKFEI
jgi:PncC family amidohydrolase